MNLKLSEVVAMATRAELSDEHYYRRLWMAARAEAMSRRQWLNGISEVLCRFQGYIVDQNGRILPVPEVDQVFGDCDARWISYYLQSDPTAEIPRRKCLRALEKLRLIDLYFRIKYPERARHFLR